MMFDRTLSYQIDAIVFLLETCPPWPVRVMLRAWKRVLERGIPQ